MIGGVSETGPRALYKQMERALQVINRVERIARRSRYTEKYIVPAFHLGAALEAQMRELQKQINAKESDEDHVTVH